MQADTHTLFEYPLEKPLEAKLLKEKSKLFWQLLPELHADLFSRHVLVL